jgi:endonuclease YncB( thermonuclease family)
MFQLVLLFGLGLSLSASASNSYTTPVNLDGKDILVYFNDGDTFQMMASDGRKASARLRGFNALESYGPVHQWGKWTARELYENSKAATENARAGSWHCRAAGPKDKYGRLLVDCPDLAEDLIKKGLAHAMFVESGDDDQKLLDIQQQAMRSRVGMWRKGVVDFVLTSVHTPEERGLSSKAYDRFVSTRTGRSVVRNHSNSYRTCEKVTYTPDEDKTASSLTYVPFEHRYGNARAVCLQALEI